MRDFIFIVIILSMIGLGVYHATRGEWTGLSIDIFIGLFALKNWNPAKNFGRR